MLYVWIIVIVIIVLGLLWQIFNVSQDFKDIKKLQKSYERYIAELTPLWPGALLMLDYIQSQSTKFTFNDMDGVALRVHWSNLPVRFVELVAMTNQRRFRCVDLRDPWALLVGDVKDLLQLVKKELPEYIENEIGRSKRDARLLQGEIIALGDRLAVYANAGHRRAMHGINLVHYLALDLDTLRKEQGEKFDWSTCERICERFLEILRAIEAECKQGVLGPAKQDDIGHLVAVMNNMIHRLLAEFPMPSDQVKLREIANRLETARTLSQSGHEKDRSKVAFILLFLEIMLEPFYKRGSPNSSTQAPNIQETFEGEA